MMYRTTLAAMGLLIAGCSSQSETDNAAGEIVAVNEAEITNVASIPASAPKIGTRADIILSALTVPEIEAANLPGELACSFSTPQATLLLASGDVGSPEGARGLVKAGGAIETVTAPGGFNGIIDGATFAGEGRTVRIAITGGAVRGGESPPRPATLTYDRADGARGAYDGTWSCGP